VDASSDERTDVYHQSVGDSLEKSISPKTATTMYIPFLRFRLAGETDSDEILHLETNEQGLDVTN